MEGKQLEESGISDETEGWYEEESGEEQEYYPVDQYDLTSMPNDFNLSTIFSFIESGAVKIPGFQRNYVWDLKRASKLIESLLIGLPVPQIFLYEEEKNKFLVIDGQQRLMSIYYFMKGRFPKKDKRNELRRIFESEGRIPQEYIESNDYFANFNLDLPAPVPSQNNRFNKLGYDDLGEYQTSFDLRTIRNVIVKQVSPKEDDSAVFEIFNRLNSGGVTLNPQEIRMSLYHSEFFEMLARENTRGEWRDILGELAPDLHMKDIEFLLRGFAMLFEGENYKPSMVKFLNGFAKNAQDFDKKMVEYLENLFDSFLGSCEKLPAKAFYSKAQRFSVVLFESVFYAACVRAFTRRERVGGYIDYDSINELMNDPEFISAYEGRTTKKENVNKRLQKSEEIIRVS